MDFMLIIFSTFLTLLLGILRYKFTYWELQGVPQLKAHFLLGHILRLKSLSFRELMHDVYKEFKGKTKIAGVYIFTRPAAVILDLDLVKSILIKDFTIFADRKSFHSDKNNILEANLFNLPGDKWRPLRTKLTPTFTSGKMKYMFPTIVKVAKEFESTFERELTKSNDIELHDLMARFTTDVIGTCVFGIECNSLKDPNTEFRTRGRSLFQTPFSVIGRLFTLNYSQFMKLFAFKARSTDTEEFFKRIVRETVEVRERENIKRNDFINLLIELKNDKSSEGYHGLTVDELAAQVFVFFIAGFETSSSNMSYGLFEMAKYPEVQEKLRSEILEVLEKHDNQLTYEAMMEMKYLDQVITETIRKYPALATLTRIATKEYQIPDTDITLERGIEVHIPVKEIHYDPEIYENPHEFRPERFDPEEVQKRHPQAFLGFGDGPRNCIGLRFGRMQIRIGLITLLKSFKFSLSSKTPSELTITKSSIIQMPRNGVWLKTERL